MSRNAHSNRDAPPKPASMGEAIRSGAAALRSTEHGRPARLRSGVRAWATVDSVAATGRHVGYLPELTVALAIELDGAVAEVSHTQPVSAALRAQLQPGARIPCRVDPADPSRVTI